MKEDQISWESREQQVSFAKDIASLLQKKFGSALSASYQGAGEVADLLLTGRGVSAAKMEEVRNFLTRTYKLDLHKIKNHGHVRGTILIHISEVTETSRKIVEGEILNRIILPERLKKKKENRQISILETNKGDAPIVKEEIKIQNKNQSKMEKEQFSIIKKGRTLLSVFLTTFFKFEGIILSGKDRIFAFDEKKTEDCQTISFRNEAEAEMGHKALVWYYNQAEDLPILEKSDVMVNFFSLNLERNRPIYISFSLPPIQGDSIEVIIKRATHVLTGYKPSSVYVIDKDSFSICYSRLVTTQKFFELIKEMGWDAQMQDDIIICKFRVRPEIAAENNPAAETSKEIEEVTSVTDVPEITSEVKEVTPMPESVKKVLDLGSRFVSPRSVSEAAKESEVLKSEKISVKNLFTPAEAIEQFKKMFNDQDIWSKISDERKVKILNLLKEDIKKALSNESFVEYLLNPLHPFFTDSEVIFELQNIFMNPNFLNLSVSLAEQVRLRLKEGLIDLDPDDLAGDLLDLF